MDNKGSYRLNEFFLRNLSLEEKHAFALVLMIKNKFENSRVYDFNPTSLSKKINASRYQINRLSKIVSEKGWGYFTNTEFVVKSFSDIIKSKRYSRYEILISDKDSLKGIVDKINFIIFKNNIQIQNKICVARSYYNISKSREQSLEEYKKIKKWFDPSKYSEDFCEHTIIGIRKLSSLLKCSIKYASDFLGRMKRFGYLSTEKMCLKVKSGIYNAKYANGFGYFYSKNGILYNYLGTKILLLV